MNNLTIKGCPFCGSPPTIATLGTWVYIGCCADMNIQKSDYLTREERNTWDNKKHVFSPEAEVKVLSAIVDQWNTRSNE